MMALVFAFAGVANAQQEIVIGEGTSNQSNFPFNSYYNYSYSEMLYEASEIGMPGTITAISFETTTGVTGKTYSFDIYMKNVDRTAFASSTDWETVSANDLVCSTTMSGQTTGWVTFTLDTPFEYDGVSSLMIAFDNNTGDYGRKYFYYHNAPNKIHGVYSDINNANPTAPTVPSGSYTELSPNRPNIVVSIIPGEGPQVSPIVVEPNPIKGVKPNNAWMRPMIVSITNTGATTTINDIDFDNTAFTAVLDGVSIPFAINHNQTVELVLETEGEGEVNGTMVVDYDGDRIAQLTDISVLVYDPVMPDVWEVAKEVVEFPFEDVPGSYARLYNNYVLPPVEVEDGYDAVYKLVFADDARLNANVQGPNAKMAIYTEEGINQVGGPDVDNIYTGIPHAQEAELTVYDGTATVSTLPMYGLYADAYTRSQYVIPAADLAEMAGCPISTLTYYTTSTPSQWASNFQVYMKEVNFTTVDALIDPATATTVYTGTLTVADGAMVVEFAIPYVYNGGNLLIGMDCLEKNNYSSCYFRAAQATGAGRYATNYTAPVFASSTAVNYIPTTTFNYMGMSNREENLISNLIVTPGTYYIAASSTEQAFIVNINAEDLPCPEQAVIISPMDNADDVDPATTILKWQLDESTTEYRVMFGGTYYCENVLIDWTNVLSESYTLPALYNNTNYFWRVDVRNSKCETLGEIHGFTTHMNVPTELHVTNENTTSIYEGDNITLEWTAIQDRTFRSYNIYQDDELIASTADLTYTVEGLEYNMEGYDFNVTALYDEGESAYSNTVSVKVSGEGTIEGYVYEQDGDTGIANATVTMTGIDEFGREQTFTFTTDENGLYSGGVLAGIYNGIATCEGYQDVNCSQNPLEIIYALGMEDVNYVMDEVFTPVYEVIAEYYPDAADPQSPYVKVHWAQNAPAAGLVEDFETGDFSAFAWNVDSQYPFEITTTNPYEGTYCMRSTNQGVDSSTSSIDVTVDIPRDGLMSFYAKISCEANYDKGAFLLDGTQVASFTGSSNWTMKEFAITAGSHNFKWTYSKDSSLSSGDDCLYIDYIDFVHDAAPATAGWIGYDNDADYEDGIGLTAGGSFLWGIHFPASTMAAYEGFTLTKASLYDTEAHTGKVIIYQGGTTAPGTAVSQQNYTCTGSGQYHEITLDAPVTINPSEDLWIIMNNNDGQYVAAEVADQGDPNGRWISIDGSEWLDVVDAGIACTWMVRGYVTDGAKSQVLTTTKRAAIEPVYALSGKTIKEIEVNPSDFVPAAAPKAAERSFQYYRVYRTDCYNDGPYTVENTEVIATELADSVYVNLDWAELPAGVYKWGVASVYAGNRDEIQEERESEIVWSNCLDNNMELTDGDVNVTVLLNSADSPEGVKIEFNNLNEGEQELHPMEAVVLDETGYYAWEDFRKGDYEITVSMNGYATIVDTVSVWEATSLRYVMIEVLAAVEDLYVSHTGWAMWQGNNVGPEPGPVPPTPGQDVTVTLTAADVWGDGSGYQMLLDADATAYGTIIPTTGGLTSSGNASAAVYDEFEYKIPENADGNMSTQNIVLANSVTITIPAGTYDWCITNPTPGDRIWIASENGNVPGRYDNFEFEAGHHYTFSVTLGGSNDRVDLTVTEGAKANNHFQAVASTDNKNIANVVKVEGSRHIEAYKVLCTSIDGEPIFSGNTENNFIQLPTEELVEGETYLVKVAVIYSTGMSEWSEVEWMYRSCENYAGAENVTAMASNEGQLISWEYPGSPVPPTPPTPPTPGEGDEFTEGFEGGLNGWHVLDVNVGEGTWLHSDNNPGGYGYYNEYAHSGNGFAMCYSFVDYVGEFNTNSFLYTPQKYNIANGSTLSFWADNANDSYPENFSVCVATADNPTASDFTQIWSGGAKENSAKAAVRHMETRAGNWRHHTIDLSAYAGQAVYIAFHDVNYDNYEIWIDDVQLTAGAKAYRDEFTFNFDNNTEGWTAIDGNNDGHNWYHSSMAANHSTLAIDSHSGAGHMMSESYCNASYAALSPNDFFVTPQMFSIVNGSTFSFWACGQDAAYCAEHFGVAVSTTGNTSASDFTTLQEWTISGKASTAWTQYSCDLSAYAGQNVYIAIRHFNVSDMFILCVDDVTLSAGGTPGPGPGPQPSGDFAGAAIFRDGEYIGQVDGTHTSFVDAGEFESHEYCVRIIYNGTDILPAENEYYSMSCPVCADANSCAPGAAISGEYVWNNANDFGALITWGGSAPVPPTPPTPGEGDEFTESFENGIPADWATIDADGDGYNWIRSSVLMAGYAINSHSGEDMVSSESYDNNVGALNPDNYLVSKQVTFGPGATFSFWASAQDASYAAEHFGVAISTGSQTNAADFVTIQEWTMVAKDGAAAGANRSGRPSGNYYQYTVDLSAYAGQTGYVAIRHFNCTDMFYLNIDDCVLSAGAKATRDLVKYNVYRSTDNNNYELIGSVDAVAGQEEYEYFDQAAAGAYYYQVRAEYANGCESEPALSEANPSNDYVIVNVTNVAENSNIALYPNPTNGNITINAQNMNRITVVSVLGQVVYDAQVEGNEAIINMAQFNTGMYMVRIATENGVSTQRVTVVK